MKVLVTGGAGAIGGNVVQRLMQHPRVERIVVLDDLSSGYVENVPTDSRVTFIRGSVADDEILTELFTAHEPDVVYHLAANFANQNSVDYPRKDLDVNGVGTLKMLEYSVKHKIKRFIYSSSSCVYGNRGGVLKEECKEFSVDTPYAITKLLGERYVRFFYDYHGLPVVTFRFFNTFGPGERPGKYRNVIPNFIARAIEKKPLPITGNGRETRDFNYMDNTVSGIVSALDAPGIEGLTFNLASSKETSILQIAEAINQVTGNPAGVEFLPRRKWDTVTNRLASIDLAMKHLNYRPEVDVFEGIRRTYEWISQLRKAEVSV